MINKTAISKFAAKTAVHILASNAIETAITSTTEADADDTPVRIASTVGGWYVSETLEDRTDALVEKAASKLQARKIRKTQKKSQPTV